MPARERPSGGRVWAWLMDGAVCWVRLIDTNDCGTDDVLSFNRRALFDICCSSRLWSMDVCETTDAAARFSPGRYDVIVDNASQVWYTRSSLIKSSRRLCMAQWDPAVFTYRYCYNTKTSIDQLYKLRYVNDRLRIIFFKKAKLKLKAVLIFNCTSPSR